MQLNKELGRVKSIRINHRGNCNMTLVLKERQQKEYFNIWYILILLTATNIALGLSQNGVLSLLPFIREEFILSKTQIGYYSTIYFSSAALLSVLSGNIVDKLGPRKSILLALSFRGIVLFLHSLSFSYYTILYQSFFTGLSLSFITPSLIKGTTIASPPEKRAFYLGIVQSGYSIGSIVGASLLPILATNFDWRLSLQSIAIFTLFIALLTYFFYQKKQISSNAFCKNNNIKNIGEDVRQMGIVLSFKESILTIFKNESLFRICALGIIFGISEGSVCTHFTMFLSEDLHIGRTIAGLGFASIYMSGIIGSITLGWISDRFFRRNRRLSIFFISTSISIMFVFFSLLSNNVQIKPLLIIILTFCLGFVAVGWTGAYFTTVGEYAGKKYAGMATGLSLLFIRTGFFIASISFGYFADLTGNYQFSWLLFGICITLLSIIFLLNDKQKKSYK